MPMNKYILATAERLKIKKFTHYLEAIKTDSQKVRFYVQMGFFLFIMWIGFEFYGFVRYLESNGTDIHFSRPPGVEGFLPISALISLKYWLLTGIFNNVHPSGLVIFIIIILLGLFLKKSFCSYVCPVGLISESLWQLGQKIFKKNLRLWKWLDYPLRGLKYLLLIFFLYAVLVQMNVDALNKFIYSPYNKVADIKMMLFFIEIDSFALWTLIILFGLSIIIKNFWCRYLCPYGALLGFLSLFSPLKVTRNKTTCTDCEACTYACPNLIVIHTKERIISDECTACGLCVHACPEEDTLDLKMSKKSNPLPAWALGTTVVLFFLLGTMLARVTGHWENGISDQEYIRRIQEMDKPVYDHNRGQVPDYKEGD
ncbi:MAG: 4Fe-4S binding protein [Calditrichales bacterium]|nr:MAG: 4Fe-4S binding protein [Calditrichales bacterium]